MFCHGIIPVKQPEILIIDGSEATAFILSNMTENNADFDETLNEEELNIITLTDEDGTDKDFEFLDLIDLDDKEYVVLLPVESEDENADGEVIILEVHPLDEENEEYLSIEDATTLNKVFEVFKERFKDDFNFVD